MHEPTTVTAEDLTLAACVKRLQKLLESDLLTLTIDGGGLSEAQEIQPRAIVVIERDELREVIRHLRAPAETDNDLEAAWGIIANAGAGDWTRETLGWREAAGSWRDRVMPALGRRASGRS